MAVSRASGLLGPSGPLAAVMRGYESRPGQLSMASAVEAALTEDRVLLCEAGTGTGKTLAYLVPAILSGRKVIVSTATRALQDQIFFKDLPLIARLLGLEPRAALLKGLSNYLCRRRHAAFRSSAEAVRPKHARSLALVDSWTFETQTGDLSELAALGEDDPVLSHVASSSDTRVGSSCQFYDECFVTRAKRDADQARLVVVNHHLFFADLALRGPHPGRVLPDYDAVIFDEAHQLEDTATLFFSVRVSSSRIEQLARELERSLVLANMADPLLSKDPAPRLVSSARLASEAFWAELWAARQGPEGRARLDRDFWAGDALEAYHRLDTALEGLAGLAEGARAKVSGELPGSERSRSVRDSAALADAFDIAARRATSLRADLATIIEGAPGRITWFEATGRGSALSSSPVDVSSIFRERVFDAIPSVVLTSATLSDGPAKDGAFRFLQQRVGLSESDHTPKELVVPSPFSFETRALLYVPDDLPLPNEAGFAEESLGRIIELIEMADGGAFVLSTSVRAMRALHRGLASRFGKRVLLQGESPKATLLSSFRAAGDAVLVATMSFWQGVDVPGRSLRLVVLDKIPFPVPTDPIVQARGEALEAAGRNAFMELQVPLAEITLKQGFGRLIRTREDYGVVALLDARVLRRGYGRRLLAALPPARRVTELGDVRRFWREMASPRALGSALQSSGESDASGPGIDAP